MLNKIPQRMMTTLAAFMFLITGCSLRPTENDIQRDLSSAYQCSILEVKNVKKIDGKSFDDGYGVRFSYEILVSGGEKTAVEWMKRVAYLKEEKELVYAKLAKEKRNGDASQATQDKILDYLDEFKKEENKLQPCNSMEAITVLMAMNEASKEIINGAKGKIALPIGVRAGRGGAMAKSESGWHFSMLAPGFRSFELVYSTPEKYDQPQSKFSMLMADTEKDDSSNKELKLTGEIRSSQTDSCLEVQEPEGTKCYTLPGEVEVARTAPTLPAAPTVAEPSAMVSVPAVAAGQGPSFDCAKASTAVEKMICSEPQLAQADLAMVTAYKAKLGTISDVQTLKQAQAQWRRRVRDACGDVACLHTAYEQRTAQLR